MKPLLLVLALLGSALAAGQGATATLTGAVVDPVFLPLPGVKVALLSPDSAGKQAVAKTDNQGLFHFAGLSAGRYSLIFQKPGFSMAAKALELSEGEGRVMDRVMLQIFAGPCGDFPAAHAINFRVLPGKQDGQILSRVVLDYKHTGAIDATISLVCPDGRACGKTRTDADGWFEFSDLAPGTYAFRGEYPKFYEQMVPNVDVVDGVQLLYSETYLQACPKGNCALRRTPKPRRRSGSICL